jgi:hypothetical protein
VWRQMRGLSMNRKGFGRNKAWKIYLLQQTCPIERILQFATQLCECVTNASKTDPTHTFPQISPQASEVAVLSPGLYLHLWHQMLLVSNSILRAYLRLKCV